MCFKLLWVRPGFSESFFFCTSFPEKKKKNEPTLIFLNRHIKSVPLLWTIMHVLKCLWNKDRWNSDHMLEEQVTCYGSASYLLCTAKRRVLIFTNQSFSLCLRVGLTRCTFVCKGPKHLNSLDNLSLNLYEPGEKHFALRKSSHQNKELNWYWVKINSVSRWEGLMIHLSQAAYSVCTLNSHY